MRETSDEVTSVVWREWILDAIRKIRFQKQRPSIQRICQAIGSHHKFHEDIVAEKLEEAVEAGAVLKVYNKGLHSYKDPRPMQCRRVNVGKNTDLSRLVAKAVRELGECDGSTLKSIENYVQQSNNVILESDTDFKTVLKNSVKIALETNLITLDGKLYKINNTMVSPTKKRRSGSPKKKLDESLVKVSCFWHNFPIYELHSNNYIFNQFNISTVLKCVKVDFFFA